MFTSFCVHSCFCLKVAKECNRNSGVEILVCDLTEVFEKAIVNRGLLAIHLGWPWILSAIFGETWWRWWQACSTFLCGPRTYSTSCSVLCLLLDCFWAHACRTLSYWLRCLQSCKLNVWKQKGWPCPHFSRKSLSLYEIRRETTVSLRDSMRK